MDTTFRHLYECEQLMESPGFLLPHFYYPGATTRGGRDGMLIRVRPERGELWLGTFAFGQLSTKGFSGLFSTPNPEWLCVVARGEGYFVLANKPEIWQSVGMRMIHDVRAVPTHSLIVFADSTRLLAYGPGGLQWKSDRVGWDGLKITAITSTSILGETWDITREVNVQFSVDLSTGTHRSDGQS